MSEPAKTRKRSKNVIKQGTRISVSPDYFGDEENDNRYYGTVTRVISENDEVRVKWEVDGQTSIVDIEDISTEVKTKPDGLSLLRSALNKRSKEKASTSKTATIEVADNIADLKDPDDTLLDDTDNNDADKSATDTVAENDEPAIENNAINIDTDPVEDNNVDAALVADDMPKIVAPKKKRRKRNPPATVPKRTSPRKRQVKTSTKNKDTPAPTVEAVHYEEENHLDYESEIEGEDIIPGAVPDSDTIVDNTMDDKKKKKLEEQKRISKKGGWTVDPRERRKCGPHINMESPEIKTEQDFFMHFFPTQYFRETVIPATNAHALKEIPHWSPVSLKEIMQVFGIFNSMQVVQLPNRRLYWETEDDGIFRAMNYGDIMSRKRFEDILYYLQLSFSPDEDQQILAFINIVNKTFQAAMTPGDTVTIDESMIKSYHRDLKGKMKIIRKPRPIGNEVKNMADAQTNIVLHIELYEGCEIMSGKAFVKEEGATTATCLRLCESIKGTGKIVLGDSWFGSVNSTWALWRDLGLFAIFIVKTAHRGFPRELLQETNIERGQWNACTAEINGLQMQAVSFMDLQRKDFISSCSTSLNGPPRITKHCGAVSRPQVAFDYLNGCAAIDIHNHVRTGSVGLEDIWKTSSSIARQFAGILGFVFSNSYLAYKWFKLRERKGEVRIKSPLQHYTFRKALSNQLVRFNEDIAPVVRRLSMEDVHVNNSHTLMKLSSPRRCYYCRHGYTNYILSSTTFQCSLCKIALCKPSSGRSCWSAHIEKGLPKPTYRKKSNKVH